MAEANLAELLGAAQRLAEAGQGAGAAALYRGWIGTHPEHPLRHAVQFNLGVLLQALGAEDEAVEAFRAAARGNPGFLPPFLPIGLAHERAGETAAALDHWRYVTHRLEAVTRDGITLKCAALKHMARLLEDHQAFGDAEDLLRQALEIDPTQRDVLQRWLSLRQRRGAWPLLEPPAGMRRLDLLRGMAPLTLAAHLDDPLLLLANAAACSQAEAPMPAEFRTTADFAARLRDSAGDGGGGRRRIGYLSSDLREHAIGHLTADLFRHHDRTAFEVFAYYTGIAQEDATKARIRGTVEHWRDIAALDDDAALRLMLADGIDILVDVNGHTRGARLGLLARRPAPVIVNWLGFPGSMGSAFHHYLIADPVIVPPGEEMGFSERVLRLPCYQPNDRHRLVADPPTRAEAGLPAAGPVLCCFNGAQKVTPAVFRRWMAILHGLPEAVLWLIQGGEAAEARQRAMAVEAGIAPDRLVFAPPLPNARHVARYALVDLFLDTAPYGAHTTAADALWMGAPVLTLPGRSFASRVCASLVAAAGVPELVCDTPEAYVAEATALGRDPARLAALRQRLLANRGTSPLFDTAALVRALEELFRSMWQDATTGRLPQPDLANLGAYLEIGAGIDHAAEGPPLAARYRAGLARRQAFAALPPDTRLWPAGAAPGRE